MLSNPFTGTQVLDPDFNDVQTFTMDCGANQGQFRMNSNTGGTIVPLLKCFMCNYNAISMFNLPTTT